MAADDSSLTIEAPAVDVDVTVITPQDPEPEPNPEPEPDADPTPPPAVDTSLAVLIGAIDVKLDLVLARLPEIQTAADDAATLALAAAVGVEALAAEDEASEDDALGDLATEPLAPPADAEPDAEPEPSGWRKLFRFDNSFGGK